MAASRGSTPPNPGGPCRSGCRRAVDAPVTRWALAAAGLLFAVLGGDRRVVRTAGAQPVARRVLRAAVGRAGGGVAGDRAGVAGGLAASHGVPAAAGGASAGRSRLPPAARVLARGVRSVRIRLAGTGQPGSGFPRRDQALAVGLRRRHLDRRDRLRRALVRPRRPVRGVQHRRVALLAVSPQPAKRPHRDRQSLRPPAVAADPPRHGDGARGATRVDRVRQLLGVARMAQLRRPACAFRRRPPA